jgi:porphobilinogen synthase
LSEISVAFAQAGADIIAPSDMMDGRIASIKEGLMNAGLGNKV